MEGLTFTQNVLNVVRGLITGRITLVEPRYFVL